MTLLISTDRSSDSPTEGAISIDAGYSGRQRPMVEATRRSRRLIPRIEFLDELHDWIDTSDDAAYGPMTRTIYIATAHRPKWYVAWCLLHEFGHHVIEVVSGKPSRHFAYDDACDWICEKTGAFCNRFFRRK